MTRNLFIKTLAVAGLLSFTSTAQAQTIGVDVSSDIGTFSPVALGTSLDLDPCGSSVTTGQGAFLNSVCDTARPDLFSVNYVISTASTTSVLSFGTGGSGLFADAGDTSPAPTTVNSLVTGGGVFQSLGTAASIFANPFSLSLADGVGSSIFSTAGTYVISLIVAADSNVTFSQGNGTNQRTFRDGLLQVANGSTGFDVNGVSVGNFDGRSFGAGRGRQNGQANVGLSQTTLTVNGAVSVPEPSSFLLLLAALAMIGFFSLRREQSA